MIYYFRNEYAWLSNMKLCDVEIDGIIYPSVENAYQSCKSDDVKYKEYCRTCTPRESKNKSKKIKVIDNWDKIKVSIMYDLLKQKYIQEPFRTLLVDTGNQNIVEGNDWKDSFWGVRLDVTPNYGENYLGRMIMDIRNKLK